MTIEEDILKRLKSVSHEVISSRKPEPAKSLEPTKSGVDSKQPKGGQSAVLLAFDATGSMAGLWDGTKSIIEEMVRRITKVGIVRLKCVAYRDYCDGERIFESSGWHTKAEPLLDFMRRITCNGGGDTPEAVEDALELAYKEKEVVTRVILIGDAPPHSVEKAERQSLNLNKRGCPVFAFRVGNDESAKSAFKRIAEASNGRYANLEGYKDLLDMISVTIVHDVGGSAAVDKYIKEYGTSEGVKVYSRSLPSAPKR